MPPSCVHKYSMLSRCCWAAQQQARIEAGLNFRDPFSLYYEHPCTWCIRIRGIRGLNAHTRTNPNGPDGFNWGRNRAPSYNFALWTKTHTLRGLKTWAQQKFFVSFGSCAVRLVWSLSLSLFFFSRAAFTEHTIHHVCYNTHSIYIPCHKSANITVLRVRLALVYLCLPRSAHFWALWRT